MAKSKYETHVLPHLEKVKEWTENGATLEEVAANLHIVPSTLYLYLKKAEDGDERYSEFSEALTRARKVVDDKVEAAAFKLATGYTVKVKKTFKVKRVEFDKKTGKKIKEYEELVEGEDEVHVAANAQAQVFWLTNRRPERWKHKPEPTDGADDAVGGTVEIPAMMEPTAPPQIPKDTPPEREESGQDG